jgi:hypothetical protein
LRGASRFSSANYDFLVSNKMGTSVSLFEAHQPEPSKKPYYIILGVLVVFLIFVSIWWFVRFDSEEKTVTAFFNALAAGNMQQAYRLWQPSESYSFQDFQNAWGPSGYLGPVKSFQIESATAPSKSDSSVAVTVLISPYQPFPENGSPQANRTKTVVIWVNRTTKSLSFPPPTVSQLFRSAWPQALGASASPSPV